MRANLIVAFFIISLIWLTPATARSYRWVDENGVTIYSQSPPPSGTAATVIKPPPPAGNPPEDTMKELRARLDAIDQTKKNRNKSKEQKDIEAKNLAVKKQNCEGAKKSLEVLERHVRVRMKTDNSEPKYLNFEERTAEIEKAQSAIKKYCE